MKEFLKLLVERFPKDKLIPKRGIIFTTMVLFSGDGGFSLRPLLKKLKVDTRIIYNFKMNSNLGIPLTTYNPVKSKKFEKNKTKAVTQLKYLYQIFLADKKRLQNRFNPFGYLFGFLQRVSIKPLEKGNYKFLGVDSKKCVECFQCVTNCPTESIVFEEKKFIFLENCIACYRCYNFCPKQAITVFNQSANPKRHKQYVIFKKEEFY